MPLSNILYPVYGRSPYVYGNEHSNNDLYSIFELALQQDDYLEKLASESNESVVQHNLFMARLETIRKNTTNTIDKLSESVVHLKSLQSEITENISSNYLLIDCLMHCKFTLCDILLKRCCCVSSVDSIELIIDTQTEDFTTMESIFADVFKFFPNNVFTNVFFIQLQIFKARNRVNYEEILADTLSRYDYNSKNFDPVFKRTLGKLLVERAILCKNKQSWATGESILCNCDAIDYYRYYKAFGEEIFLLKSLATIGQQKILPQYTPKDIFNEFEKRRFEEFIDNKKSTFKSVFQSNVEPNFYQGTKRIDNSESTDRKKVAQILSNHTNVAYVLMPADKQHKNILEVYLKQDLSNAINDILSQVTVCFVVRFFRAGEVKSDACS